tara:strand:+ start:269 stop:496 length:228 start_codon:yes stop_codon:yes gene_type:complete
MAKMNPDTVCVTQINAVEVYLQLHEALDASTHDEMCNRLSRWSDEVAKTIRESEGRTVGEILGWSHLSALQEGEE